MSKLVVLIVAVAGLALAGCSDDSQSPTAAPSSSSVPGTPTAPPETIVEGTPYPAAFATCAQGIWDKRVDEWNQLVKDRDAKGAADVVVDGKTYVDQGAYFAVKKWPATFKATLDSPATKTPCPTS